MNLVLTDYNNDGHPDVLVLRRGWWGQFGDYPLSLLRNNGNGTFDDVTEEVGLLVSGPTQTAAWADYDGDGWLDLFVGHESKPGSVYPCQLFHNNHDGTFTEVKAPWAAPNKLGVNLGFVKGVAWGDYNNDGRPDLYVSTMFGQSFLFRNDGPRDPKHPDTGEWVFTDVTEEAGLGGKRYTFPTWFFDYDNDGWLDIFAGGYSTTSMEDVGAFQMGKPNSLFSPGIPGARAAPNPVGFLPCGPGSGTISAPVSVLESTRLYSITYEHYARRRNGEETTKGGGGVFAKAYVSI